MPAVIPEDPGLGETIPVQFSDGPLQGNEQWWANGNLIGLRDKVGARDGPDDVTYKVVEISPVLVIVDWDPPGSPFVTSPAQGTESGLEESVVPLLRQPQN